MCKNIILVLFLSFSLVGCSKEINLFFTSPDDIAKELKPKIHQHLNEDGNFKAYHLKVLDLTVMKVQGNSYKGMAKVEHEGDIHNLTVNIVYDGENYMWEIPAGEFLPITTKSARQELQNLSTQLETWSNTVEEETPNHHSDYYAAAEAAAAVAEESAQVVRYKSVENQNSKPSFNCAKASNYVERTICSNPRLAKLDRLMTQNYKGMYNHSSSDDYSRNYWAKNQKEWLRERNKCTVVDCLTASYETRIDAICEHAVPSGVHPCIYTMDNFEEFDE